jgi:hypothetical protein
VPLAEDQHVQHQGVFGGLHAQADDIADLVDELRVRAELPRLD